MKSEKIFITSCQVCPFFKDGRPVCDRYSLEAGHHNLHRCADHHTQQHKRGEVEDCPRLKQQIMRSEYVPPCPIPSYCNVKMVCVITDESDVS